MKPQTSVLSAFTLIEFLAVMASGAEFQPAIVIESPVPEREAWFGIASSVPDVTGDGRPKILICANGGARGAYLYDGLSREVIRELNADWGRGIDDVAGYGRGDVIVSLGLRRFDVLYSTRISNATS